MGKTFQRMKKNSDRDAEKGLKQFLTKNVCVTGIRRLASTN